MKTLFHGFYATRIYLPFSAVSRSWRRFSNRVRGRSSKFLQDTRLPEVGWRELVKSFCPRVWEHQKMGGNVRTSELAVISGFAKECRPDSNIFEIGTFDGRTTLNMAMSAPASCRIYTLDLPPDHPTKYDLAKGEHHMVEKPASGGRYKKYADSDPEAISRISQLYGDSAAFDYTAYRGTCSLVFVDGSHAYDYAMSDSQVALDIAEPGGVVVWHDYGIWKGVTDALEEIESKEGLGLRNLRGTSLVVWRKPGSVR